jgi:hypothetical protein
MGKITASWRCSGVGITRHVRSTSGVDVGARVRDLLRSNIGSCAAEGLLQSRTFFGGGTLSYEEFSKADRNTRYCPQSTKTTPEITL